MISGTATILICRTGGDTALGHLVTSLAEKPPATAFAVGIRRFGMLIMRLTVLMVLFVLVVNISFHRPVLDSLMFALALAVGLTPELLPMIVTVTLARSAMDMSRRVCAKASVFASVRATSRAASFTSRTMRRDGMFGQHFGLRGQSRHRRTTLVRAFGCRIRGTQQTFPHFQPSPCLIGSPSSLVSKRGC